MNWQEEMRRALRASSLTTERLLHLEELLLEGNLDGFQTLIEDAKNNLAVVEAALEIISKESR
jgi:hypothetical protein